MSHSISINIEESATIKGHFYNAATGNTCIDFRLGHHDGRACDEFTIWAKPDRLQEILDALQGALNGARAELRALDEARAEVVKEAEVPA